MVCSLVAHYDETLTQHHTLTALKPEEGRGKEIQIE